MRNISRPIEEKRGYNTWFYAGNDGGNNSGSNGNYWSSTENNATNAYNLNFNSGNSSGNLNNNNKTNANSVRCVRPKNLHPLVWIFKHPKYAA